MTLQQIELLRLSNQAFDNGNTQTGEAYYAAYCLTLQAVK
mgnify:CR=1 FL=1